MKRHFGIALLVTLIIVSLALNGCGVKKMQTNESKAATHRVKQTLTLNLGTEPPSMDPNKTTDSASFLLLTNTMEGLVRLGKDGQVEKGSGLASDWTLSEDGLTYTFVLKEGARWSDGQAVRAQDFVYSWFRALDPKIASEYAYQLYYIEGAEAWNALITNAPDFDQKYRELKEKVGIAALDEKTIQVRLATPTPYFLSLMAFPTYLPVREDVVEKYSDRFASDADKLVYNGPYLMTKWVHESEVVLEKNPNYWDAANVSLDELTFKMIKDAQTAINMFDADELDLVGVPGEFIPLYEGKGLKTLATASTYYISLNTRDPVLQNVKIRKALSLALDRKLFIDKVAKNGSVPATGFTPPSLPGSDGKNFRETSGHLLPEGAQVEEAKKLLEDGLQELGLKQLPRLNLLVSDQSTTKRYAQGFQEMWRQNLGIDVELESVAFKIRLQRARKGDYQMVFGAWIGDYNDPMTFMDMFVTGGGFNDPSWSNPQYDRLIERAKVSSDNHARVESMASAERLLIESSPIIPIYHGARNWVEKPGIEGILHFPLGGDMDLKYVNLG